MFHIDQFGHAEFEPGMKENLNPPLPIESTGNPLNLIPVVENQEKSIFTLMQMVLSISIILGCIVIYMRIRSGKRSISKVNV